MKKNVLIISNEMDSSTNKVMKWLYRIGVNPIRLSNSKYINSIEIKKEANSISIALGVENEECFDLEDVHSVWYRKGIFQLFKNVQLILNEEYQTFENSYINYLKSEELQSLKDFIIFNLEKKKYIGNIKAKNGNKLIAFDIAAEIGLKIPDYFLSSKKDELKEHYFKGEFIIKAIQDAFVYFDSEVYFKNLYLKEFKGDFDKLESDVFPSMLQQYINKKIEVRTFYLNEKLFSMAIFSQSNQDTQVDFRNYSEEKPNRFVPFILPNEIEIKLIQLMNRLGLNTGSIDLIVTSENEYVFLEVNPTGQYSMIEGNCFYGLDEIIAQELV